MKRKILIVLFSIVCTLCFAIGLTACANTAGGDTTDGGQSSEQTDGSSNDQDNTEQDNTENENHDSGETEHTHSYTHEVTQAATCTEYGILTYTCTICGDSFTVYENPTGHNLAESVIENKVAATCTIAGSYDSVVYCKVCNEEISRETLTIEASGHTNADAVKENIIEATCTESGSYDSVVYCSFCGEELSRENLIINATGIHTYNSENVCENCGTRKPSEGLSFTLSSSRNYYTVSGIGTCTDTEIIIPSTYNNRQVTAIAKSAFLNQTQITSIYIPDSITEIGEGTFSGCSSIVSITLPFVGGSAKTSNDSYQYPFGYIFGTTSYTGGTLTAQCYYISTNSLMEMDYYIPSSLKYVTITGGDILYGAFYNCSSLININLPDSITSIRGYAFYGCSSLENITLPDGVTSIGMWAFRDCTSLTSIIIPDSVASILSSAFRNCTSLTDVIIGNGVTSINSSAFRGCTSLTNITISNSVTSIESGAFLDTGYYNDASNWDNGVLYIGNYLIVADTSITGGYAIKDGTTLIASYAFSNCSSLTGIIIANSVTTIGSYAFNNCSLTRVAIPDGVTSIGRGIFANCNSLEYISVSTGNTSFKSIDGDLYSYDGYTLVHYAVGKTETSFVIPDSVITIYGSAFRGCTSIKSVTIGDNVTSIGVYVFYDCTSLESVTIGGNVTSIGSGAFENCTSLTNIVIPDSVISIGYEAFYNCTALKCVTLGKSVTSIDYYTFYNCSSLTAVIIPENVTSIGFCAFLYCTALESVTFENTSGWYVSTSSTATSGTDLDVIDAIQNVIYFTDTYIFYYWYRSEN